jgi:murein DD-endopeptidase MepM/ murein hydrolase activator NlpD
VKTNSILQTMLLRRSIRLPIVNFLPLSTVFILLYLCSPSVLSQTSVYWTTYQHDSRHSGLSPYVGAQTNNAAPIIDLGSGNSSPFPVVGPNGLIYLAFEAPANSSTWRLLAVNADGSVSIDVTYPGRAGAPPTIADDGTIYVPVGPDGDLYCLFPDGSLKWRKSFPAANVPVTLGPDGTIYLSRGFWQTSPDLLLALNPDGTTKWTYDYGSVNLLQAAAVAPNGNVIVTDDGTWFVAAHDPADGNRLWQTSLGRGEPGSMSPPTVAPDGTIYVWYNQLWALDANGQVKWSTPFLTPYTASTPAIAPDGSILVAVSDYSLGGVSKLQSFFPSGQPQWSIDLVQGIGFVAPQVAIDAQGSAYVSFNSARQNTSTPLLFAVSKDGSLKWSYSATLANTMIIGSPNVSYAALFDNASQQQNDSWKLYSFGSAGSQPDFKVPLRGGKDWLLSVEIGTPTDQCKSGMGGRYYCGTPDCFHSGKGKYSLDFIDKTLQDGELTGVADVDVLAAANGVVTKVVDGFDQDVTTDVHKGCGCFGNYVVIKHAVDGYTSLYAHLAKNSITVCAGQTVKQGDRLGIMGTTGESTGVHLHFQIQYNGKGEKESGVLDNVIVDGRNITAYVVGSCTMPTYYPSKNVPRVGNGTSEGFQVNGGPPLHPNGTLIKERTDGTIYVLESGQKRPIPSLGVLQSLYANGGFTIKDVILISANEMTTYSTAAAVNEPLLTNGQKQPDGRLIKNHKTGEISIVTDNGMRRVFGCPETFSGLGYSLCNVVEVSDAAYNSYTNEVGAVISAGCGP